MPERRWVILAVIAIAQLLVVLDVTIVNIALPSAQRELGFSDDQRQWVVTAYALAFGSLLLLGGRIADLFGRKWTFVAGLIGFAGASALGGAAQSFGLLVSARAVQGVFAAMLAPAALSLLTTTFTDPAERGRAFGVYGAIAGAGGAIGLLLGGTLTEVLGWRSCLYVSIVFAAPAALAGLRLLHHAPVAARPRLDVAGTVAASAGLFALVFGLSRANTDGWGEPVTLGFLAGAVVLLAVFVALERRVRHPLLPLALVADRNRGDSFIAIAPAGAGVFGLLLFLTFYMQNTKGMTALQTGLAFLPLSVSIVFAATTVSTRLLARIGPRPLVAGGMVSGALGMALLTRIGTGTPYASAVLPSPHPPPPPLARPPPARPRRAGLRDDRRLRVRDRHARRRAARQRRGVGDGQHLAADRRIDPDGSPEHPGRLGRDRIRHRARAGGRDAAAGPRRGLRHRVLVGGRDLRARRADHRRAPALRRPPGGGPRRPGGWRGVTDAPSRSCRAPLGYRPRRDVRRHPRAGGGGHGGRAARARRPAAGRAARLPARAPQPTRVDRRAGRGGVGGRAGERGGAARAGRGRAGGAEAGGDGGSRRPRDAARRISPPRRAGGHRRRRIREACHGRRGGARLGGRRARRGGSSPRARG